MVNWPLAELPSIHVKQSGWFVTLAILQITPSMVS